MEQLAQKAWKFAVDRLHNSYSPYSHFQVGSSLVSNDEVIYFGCNLENASYGATICAERVAFFKALSEGVREFELILVLTDTKKPTPPCALCLQVMAEFCPADFPIYLSNLDGIQSRHLFSDLLGFPFGPSFLLEDNQ
ncbi:cytidine deaminase [bacterium]|nr:cytidine deaminase [bacterium]